MNRRLTLLACLVAPFSAALPAASAFAQTDMMAMARNSAGNELGVLEYCQAHGYVDGTAITAQKSVIARMPAGPAGSTDAAYALGKQGTIAGANGNDMPMSAMAAKGNTTQAALCTQMGNTVKQAVASNPAMSMPTTPGGMPAMQGGMPAMPTMPGSLATH